MNVNEREQAERALEEYRSDSESIAWPAVARRIADARARTGLSEIEMAERLEMTLESYDDLERYDDEAFVAIGLDTLRELAHVLNVSPAFILVGDEARSLTSHIGFDEISRRLSDHLARTGITADTFGDGIGWEVGALIAEAQTLSNWNVDGLYSLTKALGLDWVAALPV